MLTGNFVGEDLEPWLGVHLGTIGKNQVFVRLFCVGAVGPRQHVDAAVEYSGAGVVEDAAVGLAAGAVLGRVDDVDLLIEDLVTETEEQARQVGMGTGPSEIDAVRNPAVRRAKVERTSQELTVGSLRDINVAEVHVACWHVLQKHVLE